VKAEGRAIKLGLLPAAARRSALLPRDACVTALGFLLVSCDAFFFGGEFDRGLLETPRCSIEAAERKTTATLLALGLCDVGEATILLVLLAHAATVVASNGCVRKACHDRITV